MKRYVLSTSVSFVYNHVAWLGDLHHIFYPWLDHGERPVPILHIYLGLDGTVCTLRSFKVAYRAHVLGGCLRHLALRWKTSHIDFDTSVLSLYVWLIDNNVCSPRMFVRLGLLLLGVIDFLFDIYRFWFKIIMCSLPSYAAPHLVDPANRPHALGVPAWTLRNVSVL